MKRELLDLESVEKYTWMIDISSKEARKDYEYFQSQDKKSEKRLIENIVANSGLSLEI